MGRCTNRPISRGPFTSAPWSSMKLATSSTFCIGSLVMNLFNSVEFSNRWSILAPYLRSVATVLNIPWGLLSRSCVAWRSSRVVGVSGSAVCCPGFQLLLSTFAPCRISSSTNIYDSGAVTARCKPASSLSYGGTASRFLPF